MTIPAESDAKETNNTIISPIVSIKTQKRKFISESLRKSKKRIKKLYFNPHKCKVPSPLRNEIIYYKRRTQTQNNDKDI